MTGETNGATKNDLRAVGFTLIGVALTAVLSWVSANQTASVNYRQSCLARIDAKEAIIRGKAEVFLAAQGSLIAVVSHRKASDQDYEGRIDALVVAAYALSSYLDPKTYETPRLIAQRLEEKFYPNQTEKEKNNEQNHKELLNLMNKWNDEYNALLASFESARNGC